MKKNALLTILLCSVLIATMGPTQGQQSVVERYGMQGKNTILKANSTTPYMVICTHDNNDCSTFIVNNGGVRKKFATTSYNTSPIPFLQSQTGYIVKDMELFGEDCWFCGEKWVKTGEYILTPGGLAYPEVLHYGFIGKFKMTDVLQGSGDYEVMTIPGTEVVNVLTVHDDGVAALGGAWSLPYSTHIIELTPTSYPDIYLLCQTSSSYLDEVFLDITTTSGKVITLSRFANPSSSSFYNYSFGLRYGNLTTFGYSANTLYCYSTETAFYDPLAGKFDGITPMFLSKVNNGGGVAVTYLATGDPASNVFAGHILTYHIASMGAASMVVRSNYDLNRYAKINDVRFIEPFLQSPKMTVLVEDTGGHSSVRFPNFSINYNYDTMLYTDSYHLESIHYYKSGTTKNSFLASGEKQTNTLIHISEVGINNYMPIWETLNCLQTNSGNFFSSNIPNCLSTFNYPLSVGLSSSKTFSHIPFTATNASTVQDCNNGITY